MGCFSGIIRTVMFIFNMACLLIGLAILALGAFMYATLKGYVSSYVTTIPIILIVVGVFIFLVSFLGCCGAMRSNKCMLLTYAIVLIILLVVQLSGGIYGLVLVNGKYETFKKDVTSELHTVLEKYGTDQASTAVIDGLQIVYKCCGVTSKEDYSTLAVPIPYPISCCGKTMQTDTCNPNEIYDKGCGDEFFGVIEKYINIISIVVISIGCVELLGALLAIYLSRKK